MKKISTPIGMLLCLLISTSLLAQEEFITTWMTNPSGASSETTISIPANGTGYNYNYDVDWENDGIYDTFGVTGVITHDYSVVGTYTIAIKGDFPKIDFGTNGDRNKLTSINKWGSQQWGSMGGSFSSCKNLAIITATDNPDLTLVTDMSFMFSGATSFNQDISAWNVSHVTNTSFMFNSASSFNQPIGDWNVSNVTNMERMFSTSYFNQPIDNWDVSNVTNMASLFDQTRTFNQPIDSWNVSKVTSMVRMFNSAKAFNQPIGN